ncbi:hypothetical protein [Streptomyces flavofungini]|nr:hypothetical protein [Streptomyces flavofungini]WJV44411.1 hypothetical protein QUY26_01995 [Streptomyces flavofungini]
MSPLDPAEAPEPSEPDRPERLRRRHDCAVVGPAGVVGYRVLSVKRTV